jgi:hypothetical protein
VLLHAIRVLVHSAGLSWHGPVIPLLSPAFSNEFGVLVSFCSQDTTGWGCDGHCQVQHAHRVCMCLFPYNRRFVLQILSAGMDGHHKHDNRHVVLATCEQHLRKTSSLLSELRGVGRIDDHNI